MYTSFFIKSAHPDKRDIESVWHGLLAEQCSPVWIKLDALAKYQMVVVTEQQVPACMHFNEQGMFVVYIPLNELVACE